MQASNACTGAELGALGKLQQLRSLDVAIKQPPKGHPYQLHPHHLVSKLTSLTALQFEPCTPYALGCFSSCTSLQSLSCSCGDGDEVVVVPAEWHAVGQLTSLTRLQLLKGLATTPSRECFLAFGQLRHLVSFAAGELSLDIITALSACTKLTEIQGGWCSGVDGEADGEERASITIPSVLALTSTGGPVPFAAFPNVLKVQQADAICSTALNNLSMYCPALQEFNLKATIASQPFFSLSAHEPGDSESMAVAAWRGLGDLQGLSTLWASVQGDLELVSLVSAANDLVGKSLTSMGLYIGSNSCVTECGLMQLARVSGLKKLYVILSCFLYSLEEEEAFMFLCALWGIDEVVIYTGSEDDMQVLKEAAGELFKSGLPAPKKIVVDMV
jgi:hypothetical protein